MKRFILLSFAFLGLGFYELSGGSDFDPEAARTAAVEARQMRAAARKADKQTTMVAASAPETVRRWTETPSTNASDNDVTRSSLDLVSFEAVTQAPARATPVTVNTAAAAPDLPQGQTEPQTSLEDLAAAQVEPLSMAALNDAATETDGIAFSGSAVVANSSQATAGLDIRTVKGTLVNMRSGPGTDYDVVDQLSQATRVEILTNSGDGWVELRPVDGGATGWIAEFLLTGG